MGDSLTPEDRQELYAWIDKVPLSRQKKNITRDFSDGGIYHTINELILFSFHY